MFGVRFLFAALFLAGFILTTILVFSPRPTLAVNSVAFDVDRAEGLAAWEQLYSVLVSPRCINCHTATNYPQQGDDRHRHVANVIRGRGGRGVAGLNCNSCHQEANADSTGVPGGANWHLAPLSSADVCHAITDRKRNENMDGPALLKHHETEALVRWAWNPGRRPDGTMRTLPPLTHAQFVAATRTWVEAGTPCPPAK